MTKKLAELAMKVARRALASEVWSPTEILEAMGINLLTASIEDKVFAECLSIASRNPNADCEIYTTKAPDPNTFKRDIRNTKFKERIQLLLGMEGGEHVWEYARNAAMHDPLRFLGEALQKGHLTEDAAFYVDFNYHYTTWDQTEAHIKDVLRKCAKISKLKLSEISALPALARDLDPIFPQSVEDYINNALSRGLEIAFVEWYKRDLDVDFDLTKIRDAWDWAEELDIPTPGISLNEEPMRDFKMRVRVNNTVITEDSVLIGTPQKRFSDVPKGLRKFANEGWDPLDILQAMGQENSTLPQHHIAAYALSRKSYTGRDTKITIEQIKLKDDFIDALKFSPDLVKAAPRHIREAFAEAISRYLQDFEEAQKYGNFGPILYLLGPSSRNRSAILYITTALAEISSSKGLRGWNKLKEPLLEEALIGFFKKKMGNELWQRYRAYQKTLRLNTLQGTIAEWSEALGIPTANITSDSVPAKYPLVPRIYSGQDTIFSHSLLEG